ncbi:hypothetical protein MKW92_016648 [Papaver armeniacum]|nr:hypothetical protein MKW92_016648 [Papaver armeniacum]
MVESTKWPSSRMGVSVDGLTSFRDKYKRRKVSATRDFPEDCGRCAARLSTTKLKSLWFQSIQSLWIRWSWLSALKGGETKILNCQNLRTRWNLKNLIRQWMLSPKMHLCLRKLQDGAEIKFPPRRTLSAMREYPIGWCNVPKIRNESLMDISVDDDNSSNREDKQPKQIVEDVQDDVRSTLKRSVMKNFVENIKIASDRDVMTTKAEHIEVGRTAEENDFKSPLTSNMDGSNTNPLSSVPRPSHSTLSVIPLITLRLFQATFRKALQEEESKVKVPGTLSKRIDLLTVDEMKKMGHVPGVEVGDEFQFRVELSSLVFMDLSRLVSTSVKKDGKFLATSVVSSGGYDDIDNFDVLVYSGHGGNPAGGNKKAEDQKLERGNLALKNSIDERSPVRGKMVTTYTYDGLYFVERYWQEKGRHGNNVYITKIENSKVREGLCVDDISQGQEKMRICAVNTIDSENHLNLLKNGGEIPFNRNGAIVKPKIMQFMNVDPFVSVLHHVIIELANTASSINWRYSKLSQGMGVRSLNSIPSGSFICECTGGPFGRGSGSKNWK